MSTLLEEGRYYRTRSGKKVGPLTFSGDGKRFRYWAGAPGYPNDYWYTQHNAVYSHRSGRTSALGVTDGEDDIIGLWEESADDTDDIPTLRLFAATKAADGLKLRVVIDAKEHDLFVSFSVGASIISALAKALADENQH